jgi:hypothetical protein
MVMAPYLGLLVSQPGWSGEEDAPPEPPPRPAILVEAGELTIKGLPALDADGRIAFLAARSEYDEKGKLELRVASPDGSVKRVLLERTGGPAKGGNFRWHNIRPHLREARALLRKADFQTLPEAQSCMPSGDPAEPVPAICRCLPTPRDDALMPPQVVGPFLVSYDDQKNELHIRDAQCNLLIHRKATLAKNWYCCGGAAPSDPGCEVGWERMEVSGNTTAVFVLGHAVFGPDGCELDDQYFATWPAQRKVQESDNWNPWKHVKRGK